AFAALVLARLLRVGAERLADSERRPKLHLPCLGLAIGAVRRLLADEAHHFRAPCREPGIGDREHGGGRAIVGDKIDLPERLPCPLSERVKQGARLLKGAWVSALKAEDRLLAVADGEQRADALFLRAAPGE